MTLPLEAEMLQLLIVVLAGGVAVVAGWLLIELVLLCGKLFRLWLELD